MSLMLTCIVAQLCMTLLLQMEAWEGGCRLKYRLYLINIVCKYTFVQSFMCIIFTF